MVIMLNTAVSMSLDKKHLCTTNVSSTHCHEVHPRHQTWRALALFITLANPLRCTSLRHKITPTQFMRETQIPQPKRRTNSSTRTDDRDKIPFTGARGCLRSPADNLRLKRHRSSPLELSRRDSRQRKRTKGGGRARNWELCRLCGLCLPPHLKIHTHTVSLALGINA